MDWQRGLCVGLLAALIAGCAPSGPTTTAPQAARPAPGESRPAAIAVSPGTPADPSRPLEKIVLPIAAPSGGFAAIVIAQQQGFFRDEGLDAELPIMRTNLIAAALVSGEADFSAQAGPIVRNALAGMPFRLVAVAVDKSTRWIVGVPEIRTVEALRGQAVAVNAIGSSPHDSGLLALEAVGFDAQADVTWLAAGTPQERFLAMQQGAAQAGVFGGAEMLRADALGFTRLLRMEDVAPLPETALATTTAKLERHRPQVKRAVRAVVRALRYLKTDREGTLPVLMQYLALTREEAEQTYDATAFSFSDDGTLSDRNLRFLIEAEKRALKLTEDVPVSRVADFGPLYEALGELGITPAPDAAR